MPYIKFNDSEETYEGSIMPFKTQHGIPAIMIGTQEEIPINESGFMVYSDNDEVLGDFSDYSNHYDGNAYSVEQDEIEYGSGVTELPPSSPNVLSGIVNTLSLLTAQTSKNSSDIEDITPYVETKTAYIDDTEIVFENERQGNILISAIDSDGNSVETLNRREDDTIIVNFEPLQSITQVTLTIQ